MTKRLREIRKWGNTHVVILTQIDMKDMELKEGELIDISQIKKGGKAK